MYTYVVPIARYRKFLCRFLLSWYSIERVIFEKPIKERLRNLTQRKQTLGATFRLQIVWLYSAVLELFASESLIFAFCTFWAQTPSRISEMNWPIFTKFQDMIAQSSAQNKFVLAFRKIALFWNDRRLIVTVVKKWLKFFCVLTPCKM